MSHKLATFGIIVVLLPVLFFASEKFKDWKNLQDIKSFASNIEVYRTELEEEFFEEYDVSVTCGTGGQKFNEGSSCNTYFYPASKNSASYYQIVDLYSPSSICDYSSTDGRVESTPHTKDCAISVRNNNKQHAEKLLNRYDPEVTWIGAN